MVKLPYVVAKTYHAGFIELGICIIIFIYKAHWSLKQFSTQGREVVINLLTWPPRWAPEENFSISAVNHRKRFIFTTPFPETTGLKCIYSRRPSFPLLPVWSHLFVLSFYVSVQSHYTLDVGVSL